MGKAKTQKETPAQKALAEHGWNQLQDYKKRWLPVQQRLAQTIQADGAEGSTARRQAAGRSATDTAMAFDKAQGGFQKSISNNVVGGIGSSRGKLGITGIGEDQATSTGLGRMMSEQAIDNAYTQGLGALVSIGRGESAQVGNSLSQQAASSAQQARADAEASAINREGNAGMIGQVAGFGLQQGMKQLPNLNTAFSAYDTAGYGMSSAGLPTSGGR
jgi:hypothetical protein